jgi:undecaprenyl pyrophosphate phosphatase UppP
MKNKSNKTAFYIFNMVVQFFIETFVAMVIGYYIGKYLDSLLFSEEVVLVYVFVVIGIFAGLRNLIVRALKYSKGNIDDEEPNSKEKSD